MTTKDGIKDIDFLPASYRVASDQRATTRWRVVIVVFCAIALLAATAGQTAIRVNAERELAIVRLQYQRGEELRVRLAELTAKLDSTTAAAELVTYLRHPWPRTQIVASVLTELPPSLALARLSVTRESPPIVRYRSEASDADTAAPQLPLARRDREELQHEIDAALVVVLLEGTTTDITALHSYVSRLGASPLFAKAEVTLVEAERENNGQRFRFQARLTVRPGWGQENGPRGLPSGTVANHAHRSIQPPAR